MIVVTRYYVSFRRNVASEKSDIFSESTFLLELHNIMLLFLCCHEIVDLVNTILFLCIPVSLFLVPSLMQTFFQSVLSHWEWLVVSYQTSASKHRLSKMAENLGAHVWVMVPAGFRHLGRPQSILRLILGSRKSLRI